jgi:hypothetical protein
MPAQIIGGCMQRPKLAFAPQKQRFWGNRKTAQAACGAVFRLFSKPELKKFIVLTIYIVGVSGSLDEKRGGV